MGKSKELVYLKGFVVLLTAHLILISRLIFFPYPELFIYPYLTNLGLSPYGQIFDQHFPGLMFFPINFASLDINTPGEFLLLHLALIVATSMLIFVTVKLLTKSYKSAFLGSLFFSLWQPFLEGSTLWIDSFMPILLIPSFLLFRNWKNKNAFFTLFLSGFFLGLALIMKQVVLPMILVLSFALIFKKKYKKMLSFSLGWIIPVSIMLFYFLFNNLFSDFLYWTVTFNLTTFSEMGRKFATRNEFIKFIFIFGPSLFYGAFLAVKRKKLALSIFFTGSLMFAYARFDFIHLQPALPFAAIMFALLVSKIKGEAKHFVLVAYVISSSLILAPNLNAQKGRDIRFFGKLEEELVGYTKANTEKGDSIFTMGTSPHLYFLTETRPPGNVFVFQFPWFMKETESKILEGIVDDNPKLVLRDNSATTGGVNLVLHMPSINRYLEENYEKIDQIDSIEILRPKLK